MVIADHMADFNAKARSWAEPFGDDLTRAWAECWRGDWQLHLAAKTGAKADLLILAAADMARLAIERTGEDPRGSAAVDAALAALHGGSVDDAVRQAADEASEQEDTAKACAARSARDVLLAVQLLVEGGDVAPTCVASAKMAATALTFVAPGPRVHRKLASLVRGRIPAPA